MFIGGKFNNPAGLVGEIVEAVGGKYSGRLRPRTDANTHNAEVVACETADETAK